MIEILKQALEALEFDSLYGTGKQEAITSLRQAIAELESQEPVGRFAKFTDGIWREVTDYSASVPLYTHPPQRTWAGLTDDEIGSEYVRFEIQGGFNRFEYAVKALEAKLKEKNNA